MMLPGFGQVGDAGVRTHQNVGRVEAAFQELLLRLVQVDAAQWRLWHTSQNTVHNRSSAVEQNTVTKTQA